MSIPQPTLIKIMTREELVELETTGSFDGSPDDKRDGFIHLCGEEQLEATIQAHFGGRGELVLLTLDPSQLGEHLIVEPSRNGRLFPHLYRPLMLTDVVARTSRSAQ